MGALQDAPMLERGRRVRDNGQVCYGLDLSAIQMRAVTRELM